MIDASNSCFSCHSIIMKDNGDLYSFGFNGYGQCGLGNQEDVCTPTKIMNNPNIKSISLGVWNSFYIERNGDLYGCGYNYKGELGTGNYENKSEFTFITKGVKKICPSRYFTLIQKYDGRIFYSGEIISKYPSRKFTELEIEDVVQFSSGEYHCIFLKKNGDIYGMGLNRYGELLGNELKEFSKPTFLMNERDVVSISCTLYQNYILSRNVSGETVLKSFGKENDFFGILYETEHKEKINVIVDHPDIKSIHCGSNCCFILKENGEVFASGHNIDGQLSLGNTSSTFHFKKTELTNITHIVAGYHNTMFINDKEKTILNCGNGGSGKMGSKVEGNRTVAAPFIFENYFLINNCEVYDEWIPMIHTCLSETFKEKVLNMMLCLKRKNTNQNKVPKPLIQMIIKNFYKIF